MGEIGPFQAVVLGVLQGATEFLPVSSSGHLVLTEYFMDVNGGGLTFDVFLHLGTLLAVLVYFWRDWWKILKSLRTPSLKNPDFKLLLLLIIGTIPGGIIGVLLEGWVEQQLRSPWVVVSTLILVAFVLYFADKTMNIKKAISGLNIKDAIIIGISQGLAVVPGVSRSGITMSAGLFLGLSREEAARFSFLLSCPIILGAGLFEGIKFLGTQGASLSQEIILGFLASFISGLLVISFLLNFLKRHTFLPFVIYRILLASLVIFFLLGPGAKDSFGYFEGAKSQNRLSKLITILGKGVVNITSKPLKEDYALLPYGDEGLISGIIIDTDGHVVTDGVGIVDKRSLEITLWNGQRWPARFLAEDPVSRLAVLAIEAPKEVLSNLKPLPLSVDSKVNIGEAAFIIGNPLGLGTSFTKANIFSQPRSIETKDGYIVDRVIVFDRTVPKGLNGAALIQASGMGIGIVSGAFFHERPGMEREGLGFAIPVSYVLRIARSIITKGHVDHVWLGATCKTVTPELASILRLPVKKGVIVFKVHKGSPAWKAGLRGGRDFVRIGNQGLWVGGDIIIKVNGKDIPDLPTLVDILEQIGPGKKAIFTVIRGKREKKISLYLGKRKF
ncbi:Undecaprenyl-diphosphatase [Dissulfuribacter thermophilus]|uniref:Undecaprenyl-diphosphatase n=1 Tax=Dissulfuribacter thermophilus TaxID=1156395 RepID=A0A1B9F7C7_9BACT|nr:undecaprenyl-diphosphatase UppP [Dissulfuribacter thermophilus]OCC15849.1 Undecaprenyl-diphosphatase [Dissulfuribacter thermophilus]